MAQRYWVEGEEYPGDPTEPRGCLLPSGKFPPFAIFDVVEQRHIGKFSYRWIAEIALYRILWRTR